MNAQQLESRANAFEAVLKRSKRGMTTTELMNAFAMGRDTVCDVLRHMRNSNPKRSYIGDWRPPPAKHGRHIPVHFAGDLPNVPEAKKSAEEIKAIKQAYRARRLKEKGRVRVRRSKHLPELKKVA